MIIGLFPELLSRGGVQRVGRHIAATLASHAEQRHLGYSFLSLNDPSGIYLQRVGNDVFTFRGFGRAKTHLALEALRRALGRGSIVVSAHPNLVPVALMAKALVPKMRIVAFTHGIEVWTPLNSVRKWALRRSDVVLAPSADTYGKVVGVQGVGASKVRHLPWGLDPEFTADSGNRGNPKVPPRFPVGRVILTVGRMAANERYKGLDHLLEALPQVYSSVPDLRMVVVGDGDDRCRLETLAQRQDIEGRVCFLGELTQDELIACYRRCDVFAMPSRGEGFGLVFLEAMASGKPVLASRYGAPSEFIHDGEHGLLVDPEDSEAIARALTELLTSRERALKMGEAARRWVRDEYSYERFRERFHGILRDDFRI